MGMKIVVHTEADEQNQVTSDKLNRTSNDVHTRLMTYLFLHQNYYHYHH